MSTKYVKCSLSCDHSCSLCLRSCFKKRARLRERPTLLVATNGARFVYSQVDASLHWQLGRMSLCCNSRVQRRRWRYALTCCRGRTVTVGGVGVYEVVCQPRVLLDPAWKKRKQESGRSSENQDPTPTYPVEIHQKREDSEGSTFLLQHSSISSQPPLGAAASVHSAYALLHYLAHPVSTIPILLILLNSRFLVTTREHTSAKLNVEAAETAFTV
ncbi:unnamed protein product [Protopolystoma xenopodis]|uniref:Uncharacterized protein n=1 Tax=Protopolystoma xenopodis TaxID=117903 RepID=A0A3S5BSZ8_9PLAT|nr:unnamed protein product [Protopolystoma xenopodis]